MKIILSLLLLFTIPAQARVFNVNEADLATYFKGSYGTSNLKDESFEKSSGAQTIFSEGADFNWAGEIGFAFPGKDYSVRVGIEVISPSLGSDIKGKNSSGTELMSLDSSVLAFFPVVHFEYYVAKNALGRVYWALGGGYGKVSMKNNYTFTTAGDSAYTPLTTHTQKASQLTYMIETSLGYEMSFVQTSTVSFDFGYRYSIAKDLKYDGAGSDFSGGHADGDPVLDSDGTKKTLDLGGVFAGLSFRFYFN